MTQDLAVTPIDRLSLRFVPRPWTFAQSRRAEIGAYFARLQDANPNLWNGRVLLLYEHRRNGGVFEGAYLETDFASFIAWRDWGFPDRAMRNCFAPAALEASDGAFILGVMADRTANAGRIYFPCGTPDPGDIEGTSVNLTHSVQRELQEETGIAPASLDIAPGWLMVDDGARIAMLKPMRSSEPASILSARIRRHIASEPASELSDIRVVRGLSDLDPNMPDFVRAFLRYEWKRRGDLPGAAHEAR